MDQRYPKILNLSFIFALILVSMLIPSLSVRVVLGIISLVLFSRNLGKSSIPFVILSLIVLVVLSMSNDFWDLVTNMRFRGIHMSDMHPSRVSRIVEPDVWARDVKHLNVDITAVRIVLDPDMDGVKYPSDVDVKRVNDVIELEKKGKSGGITHVVVVGKVDSLNVSGAGVEITGRSWDGLKKLYIEASGLMIEGNLKANEMSMKAAGVRIDGNLQGDTLIIKGSGLKVKGHFKFKDIDIKGVGVLLDVYLEGVDSMGIKSTSLKGSINYTDSWLGERYLKVKGFGTLEVYLSKDAGELNIDSELTTVKTIRR